MPEIVGRLHNVEEKIATNGGSYWVLDLAGQEKGFFDWDGVWIAAGAGVGDLVRIEHSGKHRRVKNVAKVTEVEATPSEAQTPRDCGPSVKDRLIARMNCLRTAAELLAQSDLNDDAKETRVVQLAERMEQWVLR